MNSSCFKLKPFTLKSSRYYTSATVSDQVRNLLHFVQLSITRQSLKLTRQSHARILLLGLDQNPFLATKLISSYSNLDKLADSRLVFDSVRLKNVFLWNTLIAVYAKSSDHREAFRLFGEMCRCGDVSSPDDFTAATLAKVSGEIRSAAAGKSVHGKSTRLGFVLDTVVSNSLVSMYFKCGDFDSARKVFDEIPQRNVGSWNALIAGYGVSEDRSDEVWEIVKRMNFKPDGFTISSLLPLCRSVGYGREIHCYIVRNGLDFESGSKAHMSCCLIDMYSKCKRVSEARWVFDRLENRNVYAWTTMIKCYVLNGDPDEALTIFRDTRGVDPNRVSLISVLPAFHSRGTSIGGREIHCFATRRGLIDDVSLCNALIDMYSKCGRLELARRVFDDGSYKKDAITWASMICGYGSHGMGVEAVSLYDKMAREKVGPDAITIVGVLTACGRSGMVEEGLEIYRSAIGRYRIEPTAEICACVVDMLGRSGRLGEALEFIGTMRVKPGASVWGSLVNASDMHGDSETRDIAYRCLIEAEDESASSLVALSNSCAVSGEWDGVARARAAMRERGLRKEPGCSWISVNKATHCFYVCDKAHPCSNSIYQMIDYLLFPMKAHSSLDFEFF